MNIVAFKKILLNKTISSVDVSDSLTITFSGQTVLNIEEGHFNVEQIDTLRLLHKTVVNVLSENNEVIEIVLDINESIFVNLSDDSYSSPEAAQIYINNIPVLVVN